MGELFAVLLLVAWTVWLVFGLPKTRFRWGSVASSDLGRCFDSRFRELFVTPSANGEVQ